MKTFQEYLNEATEKKFKTKQSKGSIKETWTKQVTFGGNKLKVPENAKFLVVSQDRESVYAYSQEPKLESDSNHISGNDWSKTGFLDIVADITSVNSIDWQNTKSNI